MEKEEHKEPKFLKLAGIICIIYSFFLLFKITGSQRLSFATELEEYSHSKEISYFPKRLLINDLGIDITIHPARIENGIWPVTTKGVTYLESTAIPGETGNSVIYGHNWPHILGRLLHANPGQEISIVFSDGSVKKFDIAFTQIVTPDQVHILKNTDDIRLTIYTCSGFLDHKRFVVTAVAKE